MVFAPRACALRNVTGTTSDSGSEVRNMNGPMSVMPTAVVEVPMVGTLRSLVTGPTANISFDSVGPMIATTWSRPISLRAALIAWFLSPPESSTVRSIFRPPSTPFWFTSSSASVRPDLMAMP